MRVRSHLEEASSVHCQCSSQEATPVAKELCGVAEAGQVHIAQHTVQPEVVIFMGHAWWLWSQVSNVRNRLATTRASAVAELQRTEAQQAEALRPVAPLRSYEILVCVVADPATAGCKA